MTTYTFPRRWSLSSATTLASLIGSCLVVATFTAHADWPNTNATKWVQLPDQTPNGLDVLATQLPGSTNNGIILADDFLCTNTGPITDIHIWTSWLGNNPNPGESFVLGIWSDVPATNSPGNGFIPSHPGAPLWTMNFNPGQYVVRPWLTSQENFWNPDMGSAGIMGPDSMIWEYNFFPPAAAQFNQQGSTTSPVVYWLSMTAVNTSAAGTTASAPVGWKTSTNHWNDDAVFGHVNSTQTPLGDWQELFDPRVPTLSLDLSFALTTGSTRTNPPPPGTNKWLQLPDQSQNGLDVQATFADILADDFLCTNAGQITNIQVWLSWLGDNVDSNAVFTLAIWSDVPAAVTAANALFSHPGALLWTSTFGPGNYTFAQFATGAEGFYNPDIVPGGIIGTDTKIWQYNFNPQVPFCQQGSTNSPVVYWLSLTARTSPNSGATSLVGWKTSTNHWNDDAVHGHLNAVGTPIGDWQDMHDPRSGISLDLSFQLKSGPATTDCDPVLRPKFQQLPDQSANGLDVWASAPRILGDDFLCRSLGAINGVTVWGSWLNDILDTNTTFQLGLWTDVPGNPFTGGQPSHPGQLLCSTTFYPPQTVGTSLLRYKYSLYASNLSETFYYADAPAGTGPFIGTDTQIWRYDFYPRPSCWMQFGSLRLPQIYWLTLTANTVNTNALFGWKTSTNHFADDGVIGHLAPGGGALGDWKDLHDPRTSNSLDLSFALRTIPIIGINKDLKNTTSNTADGVQIIVAGVHEITWHYDDAPTPWANFVAATNGGNTVLTWSGGKTVAPGTITHVGFEMGGASLSIVGMNWLLGGTIIGTPIQVNHHMLGNGTTLVLNNDFVPFPIYVMSASVEFYADAVTLDMMNTGVSNRNPISTSPLTLNQSQINPGGALLMPIPPPPSNAMYAMFVVQLNDQMLVASAGTNATTDFIQLPLDTVLAPLIESIDLESGNVNLTWSSVADRTYRVQSATDVTSGIWSNVTDVPAAGDTSSTLVPIGGAAAYYRVLLLPQ